MQNDVKLLKVYLCDKLRQRIERKYSSKDTSCGKVGQLSLYMSTQQNNHHFMLPDSQWIFGNGLYYHYYNLRGCSIRHVHLCLLHLIIISTLGLHYNNIKSFWQHLHRKKIFVSVLHTFLSFALLPKLRSSCFLRFLCKRLHVQIKYLTQIGGLN